jgi:hypothetical protein
MGIIARNGLQVGPQVDSQAVSQVDPQVNGGIHP